MKQLTLFLALCFIAILTNAQINPDDVVDKFWKNYEIKGATETLDELYEGSPWVDRAKDDIENLKTQFKDLPNLVGKFHGYELLTKRTFGESYIIYIFIARYDRQPMRFQIDFYKADKEWRMHGFTYDYDLTEDYDDIAKQESLR